MNGDSSWPPVAENMSSAFMRVVILQAQGDALAARPWEPLGNSAQVHALEATVADMAAKSVQDARAMDHLNPRVEAQDRKSAGILASLVLMKSVEFVSAMDEVGAHHVLYYFMTTSFVDDEANDTINRCRTPSAEEFECEICYTVFQSFALAESHELVCGLPCILEECPAPLVVNTGLQIIAPEPTEEEECPSHPPVAYSFTVELQR
jgi:hypothetical protein